MYGSGVEAEKWIILDDLLTIDEVLYLLLSPIDELAKFLLVEGGPLSFCIKHIILVHMTSFVWSIILIYIIIPPSPSNLLLTS